MLFYAFHAVFGLIALWLVVGGLMPFRTKKITLYIGNKPFAFEGTWAIAAGILTSIAGLVALTYAVYAAYAHYTSVR